MSCFKVKDGDSRSPNGHGQPKKKVALNRINVLLYKLMGFRRKKTYYITREENKIQLHLDRNDVVA